MTWYLKDKGGAGGPLIREGGCAPLAVLVLKGASLAGSPCRLVARDSPSSRLSPTPGPKQADQADEHESSSAAAMLDEEKALARGAAVSLSSPRARLPATSTQTGAIAGQSAAPLFAAPDPIQLDALQARSNRARLPSKAEPFVTVPTSASERSLFGDGYDSSSGERAPGLSPSFAFFFLVRLRVRNCTRGEGDEGGVRSL